MQVPTKAPDAANQHIPKELKDLVRMSKRDNFMIRGDIMWMCWQPAGAGPAPQRVNSVSSGAMLLMVTIAGASLLGHPF